ncbi:MAG TPA: hypothetical protein VKH36_11945 [Acidimicrobiia bacterium]|nr:hypothetical protein [Acidimicrobiia bacterium]
MPGLDVADLLDAEVRCAGSLAPSSARREQEADVIAGVDALEDPPCAGELSTAELARVTRSCASVLSEQPTWAGA